MKTCLIVDDSRTIRAAATRLIAQLGFDVQEADNGQEGLELCRQATPDVIMLDWNMPVMNGMEFLRALPGVVATMPPVILCTTETSRNNIVEALDAGAREYIMKPYDSGIIEDKLRQVGMLT